MTESNFKFLLRSLAVAKISVILMFEFLRRIFTRHSVLGGGVVHHPTNH